MYTVLESQFIGNLELLKNISSFYPKYYEWYSVWFLNE